MKKSTIAIIAIIAVSACKPADQNAGVASDTTDTTRMGQMDHMHDSTMMGGMQQPAVMSAAQHDSMMQAMKNMPGDVQFMAMMTNHHTGLIAMAQQAANRASDDSVKTIARNLAAKQERDNQKMSQMMQSMGGGQPHAMMMAENKAQLDSLSAKSGKDYDRYFLQTIINHHRQGVAMVDEYMSKMQHADAKQMAARMKSEQQKEIRELEGKLKSL